jgi:pyruvate-ferredoxin/flavodoxin oxidoreductase
VIKLTGVIIMKKDMHTMDGNEATAHVAYKVTEASIIYPITPSTPMAELADLWMAAGKKNLWGQVPTVVEMQSEGGASGALHGALQTGALATTFTASQGLLLMIPNMYKIAGELTSTVIHVAARSLATHALSIFGDHSDVMATRNTGFAMLCSGSLQETHDMALIAHAATLEARVPFLHFFEGFRTSHEINKIEMLSDEQIKAMIDDELILAHRKRALTPDHPSIRGTAQNPDVYFQSREASNPFYKATPKIVEKYMDKLAELTGRKYNLVDYYGDPEADRVIVIMGSGAQTVRETIDYLSKKEDEKLGVLQIHLYRPFPVQQFLAALPPRVKFIAVLDRTKEPGSAGEPLYQDVATVINEAISDKSLATKEIPQIIGGRYGLSSKEFTPAMVKAVFDELNANKPKNHFSVGINDDVSDTSLEFDPNFITESNKVVRAIFYGLGSDGTVGANKNSIKIIGEGTNNYAQGYFVYDSKKSGSRTVSHLRFGPEPINSPYLVQSANFIAVHQFNFVDKTEVLLRAAKGATFLLNSTYGPNEVWEHLPVNVQQTIIDKKLSFYVIDAYKVAQGAGMGNRINSVMQTCFFALSGVLPKAEAIKKIKEAIHKTYIKKGEDVVKKNYAAVDKSLENLHKVKVPDRVSEGAHEMPPAVSTKAPKFVQDIVATMMVDKGDELPVSSLPLDGTYPSGTTKWEKRNVSLYVADWDPETCIQCGKCSAVCPHGVIRCKSYDKALLDKAPEHFKFAPLKGKDDASKCFTLQTYLEDCTGCALCNQVCPAKSKTKEGAKAINMAVQEPILEQGRENIEFFESLPEVDRNSINSGTIPGLQYLEPLFEFSGACAGCGETPYVKLISQLFGDRMIAANATGCSSIYGGNLPTTPWSCNKEGKGPAWSNSLFEDNAEFGLGFRITIDQHKAQAIELLQKLKNKNLAKEIIAHVDDNDEQGIHDQRERVAKLKVELAKLTNEDVKQLLSLADNLVKRSIWIIGGDGWAYDIGYGGLDHVLASGRNVNILVLDTEVYSNTGGQSSKATSRAAVAQFAAAGKAMPKKDLGVMAMTYGYIYVAQISMGANPMHALKAIKEAENYNGPSLIIAYSHCIAHGINMMHGLKQQELAVASGYWPLYSYNPDKEHPFELVSKAPSIPLTDYVYNENRFKSLLKTNPERAKELMKEAQEDVNKRWKKYEQMATAK